MFIIPCVSDDTCHMSGVTCLVSGVRCPMSGVTSNSQTQTFFLNWWRYLVEDLLSRWLTQSFFYERAWNIWYKAKASLNIFKKSILMTTQNNWPNMKLQWNGKFWQISVGQITTPVWSDCLEIKLEYNVKVSWPNSSPPQTWKMYLASLALSGTFFWLG